MTLLTWIGIGLCLTQSAMFSGSNLAFFSISKLRLELEVGKNDEHAIRVLVLREDSNFLLVTILWGNVAVNVLLPSLHCHRPIIVRDGQTTLGRVVPRLKVNPEHVEDDVIDEDIILLWGEEKS